MSRAKRIAVGSCCLGILAGSAGAVWRAATTHGVLAVWGWRGYLDFVILALAGAVAGALLGSVLGFLFFRGGPSRPIRGSVLGAAILEGVILALFAWMVIRSDPTALPVRPRYAGPRPPDVVVLIYDAVRADIVSDERGGIPDWAPRLKGLASSGVLFRDAVAPAPWTLPSHASLFTGLSSLDHGAVEECPHLAEDFETLAESLRMRGYRTVGLVANPWLDRTNGFAQGFEVYLELWRMNQPAVLPLFFRALGRYEHRGWIEVGDPREDKGARLMTVITERLLSNLRSDDPLFLFINLVDAHPPYWAPRSDRLQLVPDTLLTRGIDPGKVPQNWQSIYAGNKVLGEAERAVLRGLNMGEVAYMDRHLGRLLDELERSGRMTNALVAVTSDHGAGLGEDRLLGSGFDLREEMLRIPMVVHFPGGRGAGTVRDDLVFFHDLHPTVLELTAGAAGLPGTVPASLDPDSRNGRSLLAGSARSGGLAAYERPVNMLKNLHDTFPEFDASSLDRRLLAFRGPRYKLVRSSVGRDWLYDLAGRGEHEDLSASLPELRDHQLSLLEGITGGRFDEVWRRSLAATFGREHSDAEMDPETLEMLKSLGYTSGGSN